MRNIISQITALWDICRRDRKTTSATPENVTEPNPAVLNGRTWRPWVCFIRMYYKQLFSLFRNIYMR
jgi:hypothetical protein